MKPTKMVFIALSCLLLNAGCAQDSTKTKAEKQGWHLSMQSYTFHLFTVTEALSKTEELGIRFIEIYPGQKMGEDFGDLVFGYDLSMKDQERLRVLAAGSGVKIISSGVWTAKTEEWEPIFAFAKNMGMEFISAEPAPEDWDVVEELAKKHNIKVAVHNHPSENSYWKPEILLASIGGRDGLLGACVDVGHYKRMGLDPIPSMRQLKGKVIALHFKDIAPQGEEQNLEDVVWGQGILNVKGMMKELKKQKFKGYFTIEYEADWENNLPQIKQSIEYFNQVAESIL
ncbi:sugar phosphate isomerase/epimerase [Proteiniphilum sp. X52]|uniref:sugar phosphate isomerase/epimerase family protein n=1 Tax=Proteiniphilum sp. X52 TaxID=2382159 RepID=UPI000F0A0FF2|nr:sugar phosphate isomerase/epimerase [Proteiniphilum sp. X52]RNC66224.1 sugar phosphate isomerase/epimerase [Proteiniphilum sp. X52]